MAFPFSPETSYTDASTPNVTAAWLNKMQTNGVCAVAVASYDRIPFYVRTSTNSVVITIARLGPFIIKDAVTSQYVGMPAVTGVSISTGFLTSSWGYIYVRVSSGVAAYSISSTAPEATLCYKSGDETYRYICAVWFDSFGNARRMHAFGGPSGSRYTFERKVFAVGSPNGYSPGTTAWQTFTGSGETSLPSTTTIVRTQCTITNASTGIAEMYVRGAGSGSDQSSTGAVGVFSGYGSTTSIQITDGGHFEIYTNGSFDWSVSSSSPYVNVRILIEGFYE